MLHGLREALARIRVLRARIRGPRPTHGKRTPNGQAQSRLLTAWPMAGASRRPSVCAEIPRVRRRGKWVEVTLQPRSARATVICTVSTRRRQRAREPRLGADDAAAVDDRRVHAGGGERAADAPDGVAVDPRACGRGRGTAHPAGPKRPG